MKTERVCVTMRHPGQVPQSGMQAGIQNDLSFRKVPGFRVSSGMTGFSHYDTASKGGKLFR